MSFEDQYKSEIKLFCKHIRELRTGKGLTQKQLTQLSGITQSQISLLEKPETNPNPEFNTLVKLAWGLKVHLEAFFLYSSKSKLPIFRNKHKSVEQRYIAEKEEFGRRVEKLCRHRKLKQDELSILAGIYAGDLSRYINGDGNVEFYSILKIAGALEVRIYDLFDYDGLLPDNKTFKGRIV